MKIELTDSTKLHSAISLADKRRFYDALCIFAQVETYESMLNRIACLCEIDDVPFAIDLYRQAKRKYGAEYAVSKDVRELGGSAEAVLDFCEASRQHAASTEGARRADKALLVEHDPDFDDDFSAPDLNYLADDDNFYDPYYASNKIFDIKSEDYFDFLRVNMERCFVEGDEAQAQKYAKRLLAVETDHLPTLEAQISLVLYLEKYKSGVAFAERLASVEGGSHAAVGGAIEILMRVNPKKHLAALDKLLQKALKMDDVTLFDLEDYVYIASDMLHDYQMANSFAEMLYADFRFASLEALKMCACAFYNVGKIAEAKNAAISLLRVAPDDIFARILCDFLQYETEREQNAANADGQNVKIPFEFSSRLIRHYFMPTKLTVYSQSRLIALFEVKTRNKQAESIVLDDKALLYLAVAIASCKSLMITNRRNDYYDMATFIRAVLYTYPPENSESFFAFAKEQLFAVMSDQCINEYLVARLIALGFAEDVYISLPNNRYYVLDLRNVCAEGCGADEMFCYAFGVCSTLFEIKDTQVYIDAYREITQKVPCDPSDPMAVHKIAYAMLCSCKRGFEKSEEAEFFQNDEKKLYDDFKKLTEKSV